ncbi:MAG: hypothetical protein WA667_29095 [Candidatus Nitrosopolaris sp.]
MKSFMKKTNDKKEYRRAQAALKKGEGKTQDANVTLRYVTLSIKNKIDYLQSKLTCIKDV